MGLGRDRNAINDRLLILGIPPMFEDMRHQIGQDEQLLHKFKSEVGKLAMLTRHDGTTLIQMVDYAYYSPFPSVKHDQKRLAEALHQWFQEQYPQKLPVCSHCSKARDQAEVSCHHL